MKDIIAHTSQLSRTEICVEKLEDAAEKLVFANHELKRMEFEGGKPLSKKENLKVDASTRLARRIKRSLSRNNQPLGKIL